MFVGIDVAKAELVVGVRPAGTGWTSGEFRNSDLLNGEFKDSDPLKADPLNDPP